MTDVNIVNAEVLTVGPDEALIVRISDMELDGDAIEEVCKWFDRVVGDRYVIFQGDVEFAKVKQGE